MPEDKTGEREIASVLWIEKGHHIEVAYADGEFRMLSQVIT